MVRCRREVLEAPATVHGGDALLVAPRPLDFSSNVSPLGPPPRAIDALKRSLDLTKYYPDHECRAVKEAVSGYLGVEPGQVVVGCGVTELIRAIALAFIDRGDVVVTLSPTFSEYEASAALMGAGVRYVELKAEDGFKLSSDGVVESLDPTVKAVFICNPNNPTGGLMELSELRRVVEEAGRLGAVVVVDESYQEFLERPCTATSLIEDYPNLVVLRSITKPFGMPGLRVGYAVASEETARVVERARVTWSVGVLEQVAAAEALKDRSYLERLRRLIAEEKPYMARQLSSLGLKVYPSAANFLLVDVSALNVEAPELRRRLLGRGILIRDCSSFRGLGPSYVRLAIRLREENEALIEALREEVEPPCGGG